MPVDFHTFINLFKIKERLQFFILDTLETFHGILGINSLKKLNAVIYTGQNYMTLNDKIKVQLKEQSLNAVNNINFRMDHMTKEQKMELYQIVKEHKKLFSEPDTKLTYTTIVKGDIRTSSDEPVYSKHYPYPMALKSEVEKQIKELLENDIIRPSRSPYNSPIWVVPKKLDASGEKKYRVVIDYRKLNAITIADKYPIPEIDKVLIQLGNSKIFSVLDLQSGFHQIPLRDRDIEKTAFSINNAKYEFKRLPFGLKNAPSIFQRALDDVLRDHIGKICFVYIDDIIIFSQNKAEHSKHLKTIFDVLLKANFKVQLNKCEFFKSNVKFLGFIISEDGVKKDPDKVKTIKDFPTPKTIKDLRSFLGLSGFYRKFIQDYARMAKPLTILLRGEGGRVSKSKSSKIPVMFNKEATEAFEKIKQSLISDDVILTYPDFNKDFYLTTDASKYALGAVLEQDGKPITFISRTLSKTEENYAANEKEMLAIIWALNTLESYLYGAASVKIFTDHQPLTFALSNKNHNSKMKRWKAILEEYNYELKYKPGRANVVADALSRPPMEESTINSIMTQHSCESSQNDIIAFANYPINVYKNQLIIDFGQEPSYEFEITFPTYHRHKITISNYNQLHDVLKRYLDPSLTNALQTDERTFGQIQELYPLYFKDIRIQFARETVRDIADEEEQEKLIINEHNRAHRNAKENKKQLIEKYFFPKMVKKISRIVKNCNICKENKYDRHPHKTKIQETPIPQYPGQIVHLDIYITNKKTILTAIDKFSKYAQARITQSRSTVDLRPHIKEILINFGIPETVVIDNEKSLNAATIRFMLENQFKINIYKVPPYASTANGQIERFHSTLTEIMRCLKAEKAYSSFEELLERSLYEYNHSIHSTTSRKPVEIFFNRKVRAYPDLYKNEQQQIITRLKEKQQLDLQYHNQSRKVPIKYEVGQKIFVKENKRLGTKLSPRYKQEIVKSDENSKVITESGRIVSKNNIKNT